MVDWGASGGEEGGGKVGKEVVWGGGSFGVRVR